MGAGARDTLYPTQITIRGSAGTSVGMREQEGFDEGALGIPSTDVTAATRLTSSTYCLHIYVGRIPLRI